MTDFKYACYQVSKPATIYLDDSHFYGSPDTTEPKQKDKGKEKEKEKEADESEGEERKPKGPPIDEYFHHSSFLAGAPVAAAGEIRVKNGVIELISNCSGHYKPPAEFLKQVFMELRDRGYDFGAHPCLLEDASHGMSQSKAIKVDSKKVFEFTKEIVENFHKKVSRSKPAPEQPLVDAMKGEEIKSKTHGTKITYLSPNDAKKYQLKVDGKLLKCNGKTVDTTGALIFGTEAMKDRFIFVMSPSGDLYATDAWTAVKWNNQDARKVMTEKTKARAVADRKPM